MFSCRGNAEYEKGGHERDDTAGYYSDVCLDSELLGTADYNDTRGWDQVRDMGNESLGDTKNISEREKSWQTGSGWTGTQYGEGQPGMGQSSLYQGPYWVGQPSQVATQGGLGGQPWTGTQYGEGQPGMGPSSMYQGARWAGQSGYPESSGYGQVGGNLPPWTRATAGQGPSAMGQGGLGGQNPWGGQRWTGTEYGEGQSGMGPSSLHQGAHWQGQSGLAGGQEFPR